MNRYGIVSSDNGNAIVVRYNPGYFVKDLLDPERWFPDHRFNTPFGSRKVKWFGRTEDAKAYLEVINAGSSH